MVLREIAAKCLASRKWSGRCTLRSHEPQKLRRRRRGERACRNPRLGYDVYPEGVKPVEATSLPERIEHFARSEEGANRERVDGNDTFDNVRNWVAYVRSRKQPNAHIRAGVEAAATSHWANNAMHERRVIEL